MISVGGLISIGIFYVLILGVGIWAGKKKGKATTNSDGTTTVVGKNSEEEVMLAGRNIGLFVGVFTMVATWVGGGYINGAAEYVYSSGLIWCQAPFGYSLSLVFGGLFFARQMREKGYVTMLDPLQDAFGERMGGLLYLPALCGEIFWAAGILGALGATLSVVVSLQQNISIIISAFFAIAYTFSGGLYSVAYTDVIQLICIFVGLVVTVPFAWLDSNVDMSVLVNSDSNWLGEVKSYEWGQYIDGGLLLIFGGIPWQVYFQRVLSCKNAGRAQTLSFAAAVGCFLMAIPPILIGSIARATDWNSTMYGKDPAASGEAGMILPLVMNNLTPNVVAYLGLGAVSAAVMSSVDSSVLSASSMFARNIYRLIFRQQASETELKWVMRIAIVVVGSLATIMALTVTSIYALWFICSDLIYVILFPQLLMVVHFESYCNTYGSALAYVVALFFRLGGGEPALSIPAFIHFPFYDSASATQYFPFRTFVMLLSLAVLVSVSALSKWLFENERIPSKFDFFKCFPKEGIPVLEQSRFSDVHSVDFDIFMTRDTGKKDNGNNVTKL